MNCSPLRGVRVEPLLPSLPSSPLRMQTLPISDLDTSLDDEFAMQQQQQTAENRHADDSLAQPTLRELADEALPSSHEASDCESGDEELEEECSRSAFSLPAPTPTPMRAAPSPHALHAHAFLHAHTMAAHSSPATAAPQLVTPPTRVAAQRYATPTGDAAAAPLVDYRGTPIDTAPRRNLLEGQGENAADWNAFRAAAAASLSHTAQHTVLHSLASPSKSVHLHRLEAQMAALTASSPRPHHEYNADAYADSDQCAAVALSHADAESSVLQVEESAVELASDAVEEIGKHDDDGDDDDGEADDELDASTCAPQRWGTSPHYNRNREERHGHDEFVPSKSSSFGHSPPVSNVASPFFSPAAAVRAHETRSAQKIRGPSPTAATPLSTTWQTATPSPRNQSATGPAPAPDSQPWSTPMELSKAASKQWLEHSRYNQHVATTKQKKSASLLSSASLPKITPPTLDQWQREVDAKRPGSATPKARANMHSSLTLIKSKAAHKRASTTAKSTAAAATTVTTAAVRSRPTSGPPGSSSLQTLSRAPLAPLPLNSVVANPWSSAEQQAAEAAQPFHTPLKRTSVPVRHTPATIQPPPITEEERSPPTPVLHQLSPSLAPPAQPAQTYRAVVDGQHVLPPALSWVAAHQIQPDRIHQNLRFITTAFAHAD